MLLLEEKFSFAWKFPKVSLVDEDDDEDDDDHASGCRPLMRTTSSDVQDDNMMIKIFGNAMVSLSSREVILALIFYLIEGFV